MRPTPRSPWIPTPNSTSPSASSNDGRCWPSELVAAVYHQHYKPKADQGAQPGPYGWYLDQNVAPTR